MLSLVVAIQLGGEKDHGLDETPIVSLAAKGRFFARNGFQFNFLSMSILRF